MIANEAMTHCEEQIRVGTGKTRKRVKSDTINSHKDWSRKVRLGVEFNPMRVMVIGHDVL
jgi:hypothetical protein